MSETLMRQWAMLQCLPRAPRKIDAATLQARLANQGFVIDRRSIQRDLQSLQAVFPLSCDDLHRPYGWSWSREAPAFDLPGLDVHAALAWRQAAVYLRHLLPSATWQHLEPHTGRAEALLSHLEGNLLARWPDKVKVVPPGPPQRPPVIDPAVLEAVHRALIEDRQLELSYKRRAEQQARVYTAHPQGLVWRGAVGYLVVTVFDYDDPLHFVLHRMVDATVQDAPRKVLEGFSLDAYVASQAFDFVVGEAPLWLELRMDAGIAVKFTEGPLSPDQRVEYLDDGRVLVSASVADTNELRAWLRSFGPWIEVLGPPALRAAMAGWATETAVLYAGGPPPAAP